MSWLNFVEFGLYSSSRSFCAARKVKEEEKEIAFCSLELCTIDLESLVIFTLNGTNTTYLVYTNALRPNRLSFKK